MQLNWKCVLSSGSLICTTVRGLGRVTGLFVFTFTRARVLGGGQEIAAASVCVVKDAAGNVSLVFRERRCLESSKEIVFMTLHIGSGGDVHVESSGSSICITVRGLERATGLFVRT